MSNQRMLDNFAQYPEITLPQDLRVLGMPVGARCMRIIRLPRGWRVWIATTDYKYGTYLELFDDGRVLHCTTRVDEGEEVFWARPSDDEIRRKLWSERS